MRRKQVAASGIDWDIMLNLTDRLKADGLYRDYLLIYVGSHFGLRISDLLPIRWRDVLDKKEIILTEKKTKKSRCITINHNVRDACNFVAAHLEKTTRFSKDHYVFASKYGSPISISYVNKRLKLIFNAYEISVVSPSSHTLRKTFGKRVYESDGKSERALIYLSEMFSHSSISITRRYIGIRQEQLANIYKSL